MIAGVRMVVGQAPGFGSPSTRWSRWEDSEARKVVGLPDGQITGIAWLVRSRGEAMVGLGRPWRRR